jgi:hypothetical protein
MAILIFLPFCTVTVHLVTFYNTNICKNKEHFMVGGRYQKFAYKIAPRIKNRNQKKLDGVR